MPVINAIEPTPAQIKAFLAHKQAGEPVFMLNLLKFKARASYADSAENPDNDISGREAYKRYAAAFTALVKASGIEAGVVFGGDVNTFLIGGGDGASHDAPEWDAAAIFRYPNAQTMFDMVSSEDYRKIHYHRRAGLAGQLLISCDGSGVF